MHSPDWEPLVWQVLENLIFPKAPASQPRRVLPHPPGPASREAGWSRRRDCGATRLRVGGGRVDEHAGARPPQGPRLSPRDGGRGQRPEPGALRAALSAAGVSGTICSSPRRSALCVKLPSPSLLTRPPPPAPVPSDSRGSKERSPRGRDESGSVMGSDSGRRARGAGSRGPRAAGGGRRPGRERSAGSRAPGGRAAPEGGSAGSHSRPGRRAPLKWPQLHTPTRR